MAHITAFGLKGLTVNVVEPTPDNLGGKGAGLVFMDSIGVKVPPGFVLHTSVSQSYYSNPLGALTFVKKNLPPYIVALKDRFGYMPLVSVRSGARVSMPGMMDTILNVGLDANTYPFWAEKLGVAAATNSYCRLIEMYGSVVKGIERKKFEGLDLAARFVLYKAETGADFPEAEEQLFSSIEAVFKSWDNERAKVYRKANGFSDSWGTGCVIQSMVFGNLNDKSGTGVLFTRNPDTGENLITGEFMVNAQGEDVVAGIRTPMPLTQMVEWSPAIAAELNNTVSKLEIEKKDVQDVEFTIQNGELFILQTRNAKRSARAAMRIMLDMVKEGMIDHSEARNRVTTEQYDKVQLPVIDPTFDTPANWVGIPACNGVVTGVVVLTSEAAINCTVPCILVREETCPDDISGMIAAQGVLTMTGGATSHAAVVARAMDKPCVVGLGFTEARMFAKMFPEGSTISIDGATGRVWACAIPVISGAGSALVEEYEDFVFQGLNTALVFDKPNRHAKMLDLTGLLLSEPKVLVDLILKQNELTPDGFWVDLIPSADQDTLYTVFGDALLTTLVSKIDTLLPVLPKVHLLCPAPSTKMVQVHEVATLADLVMTSSNYVFKGEMDATAKKVVEWLEKEGITKSESVPNTLAWRAVISLGASG